jgi:hypothetical protein
MLNLESPWLEGVEVHEAPDKKTGLAITLILDQPGEADDTFELASEDGKYKKTLGARHAQALVTGKKLLRFDGVDAAKSYKLTHIRSKSSKRLVLPPMPLKHMTEAGQRPRDTEYVYFTIPSQVPDTLTGKYGDSAVDADLKAKSPVLLNLKVEDPKI